MLHSRRIAHINENEGKNKFIITLQQQIKKKGDVQFALNTQNIVLNKTESC